MKTLLSGLERFVSVKRHGIRNKKPFDSTTYYITSEKLSSYAKAGLIRGHRQIENNLHWTKDVVRGVDNCGIKEAHSAAILGILRNIAFNLRLGMVLNPLTYGISAMGENVDRKWKIITHSQPKIGYILDG